MLKKISYIIRIDIFLRIGEISLHDHRLPDDLSDRVKNQRGEEVLVYSNSIHP